MNYWNPIVLLVRLRWKLTGRAILHSSSALVGTLLVLLLFAPAAVGASVLCHQKLIHVAPSHRIEMLRQVLTILGFVYLLLLLPGRSFLLNRDLDPGVLRPFPLRSGQLLLASITGSLLDIPLFFTLPTLAVLTKDFGGGLLSSAAVAAALFLFLLQMVALAQMLSSVGTLLLRQSRALMLILLLTAVVLMPALTVIGSRAVWLLPSRLTADILATNTDSSRLAPLPFVLLLFFTLATLFCADRLSWIAVERSDKVGYQILPHLFPRKNVKRQQMGTFLETDTAFGFMATIALTEWRNLIRNPRAHGSLRRPASLLFVLFFAWMQPNWGADVIQAIKDQTAIGSLIYLLLWQIQILTNRFGNEIGTAPLLFSFPVSRRLLLIGKNLALFVLLLLVDGSVLISICVYAHALAQVPLLLGDLLLILSLLTGVGNLLSVVQPFALARRDGKRDGTLEEPDRSLSFVYAGLMIGIGYLLYLIHNHLANSNRSTGEMLLIMLGILAATGGFYALSVLVASWQLVRRERRIVRTLERGF